ncbi:MAG: sulfite exporter TauE/SafE family protein [Chitinophagaceae bacterium]|nr:sulfite exporter TauE/SafE family protein [Chitinophagaceae bacterium]
MIEVEEMPIKSDSQHAPQPAQERAVKPKQKRRGQTWLYVISGALGVLVIGAITAGIINAKEISLSRGLDQVLTIDFALFVLAGFIAQMIDGALGMAYGASSTSMLMSFGVAPAAASAAVHTAEVFTTGASGISHLRFGNVNSKLAKALIIPGVIGAIIGAYLLSSLDGKVIAPYISLYLVFLGARILMKAFNISKKKDKVKNVAPLALFGGFIDSVGGGGWGPIVTSTLLGKGRNPRYTIGSVNLAEFFVALASAGIFTFMLGFQNWLVMLALIVGGVMAAPFGAILASKFKPKTLMIVVGLVVIGLSIRTMVKAWL